MKKYVICKWDQQLFQLVDLQQNDRRLKLDADTRILFLNANFI